jgi:hypothetical protein
MGSLYVWPKVILLSGFHCIFKHFNLDFHWSQWSNYSPCFPSCGTGSQKRSRKCLNTLMTSSDTLMTSSDALMTSSDALMTSSDTLIKSSEVPSTMCQGASTEERECKSEVCRDGKKRRLKNTVEAN